MAILEFNSEVRRVLHLRGGGGGMSRHMVKLVPAGSCIIHLLGGTADILNNITTYHSLGLGVNFGTEWLCDLGKVACSL